MYYASTGLSVKCMRFGLYNIPEPEAATGQEHKDRQQVHFDMSIFNH